MEAIAKKTYNLPGSAIEEVKSIAQQMHTSQDSVVTLAIRELARQQRDLEHTAAWTQAATDPQFQADLSSITSDFAAADADSWTQ